MMRWEVPESVNFYKDKLDVRLHGVNYFGGVGYRMYDKHGRSVKKADDAASIHADFDEEPMVIVIAREKRKRRWWERMNGFEREDVIAVMVGHP